MLVLDPQFFRIDAIPGTAFESRLNHLKVSLKKLLSICQNSQLNIAIEQNAWRYLVEKNRIKPIVDLANDHELNVALSVLRQRYLSQNTSDRYHRMQNVGNKATFQWIA